MLDYILLTVIELEFHIPCSLVCWTCCLCVSLLIDCYIVHWGCLDSFSFWLPQCWGVPVR